MANNYPPDSPYKFSHEELRVLKQCNSEAFYQRCLPLATLFGMSTYLGVQNGMLKPNPRFGATPKVAFAVFGGYILGKISYQAVCAEKLMALPGSKIGAMLRAKRGITLEGDDGSGITVTEDQVYSDIPRGSHMDFDIAPPTSDLDSYSPSDNHDQPYLPQPGSATTYEELRRRNREEFELRKARSQSPRGMMGVDDVPSALDRRDSGAPQQPDYWSPPRPPSSDDWSLPPTSDPWSK